MSDALSKQDIWMRLSTPQFLTTDSYRPRLVHYTSLEVLKAIVRGKELWFSKPSRMNDYEEIAGGLKSLLQIDRQRLNPLIPAKMLIEELSPKVWSQCQHTFMQTAEKLTENVFMSCWSGRDTDIKDADDLTMWRAYGSDGEGVAIVINPDDKEGLDLGDQLMSDIVLMPVYYENERQFSQRITESFNAFATELSTFTPEIIEEKSDLISQTFTNLLTVLICSHKHIGFEAEKECRFVWFQNQDLSGPLQDFVNTEGGTSPTFRLPLRDDAYAAREPIVPGTLDPTHMIETVLIGPSEDQCDRYNKVKALKEATGAKFEICKSKIPYRSR